MVTESRISLGKKPTREMLADFLTKHVDAATMQSSMAGLGMRFHFGREQAHPESVILSADRDDCCAETWKLVTDGPGMRTLVVVFPSGTGSLRLDEPMEIWSETNLSFYVLV